MWPTLSCNLSKIQFKLIPYGNDFVCTFYITIIGAELGGAAGARAPPLLHNPRKFIV